MKKRRVFVLRKWRGERHIAHGYDKGKGNLEFWGSNGLCALKWSIFRVVLRWREVERVGASGGERKKANRPLKEEERK